MTNVDARPPMKHALASCSDIKAINTKKARTSEKGSTPSSAAATTCTGASLPWMMPATAAASSGGSACGTSATPPLPNPMLLPPPASMMPPFFGGMPGGPMGMMPPQMAMQACMMMQMQAMQAAMMAQQQQQQQQQQAGSDSAQAAGTSSKPTPAATAAASLGYPEPLPCYPTCFPFLPPMMPGMPPMPPGMMPGGMCFPPMMPMPMPTPMQQQQPAAAPPAKQQQQAPAKQQQQIPAPAPLAGSAAPGPHACDLTPAATTNLTDADFAAFIDSFVSDVDPSSVQGSSSSSGCGDLDLMRLNAGSVRSSSGSSESDNFVFSLDDLLPLEAVTQQVESALMELSGSGARAPHVHAPKSRRSPAAPAQRSVRPMVVHEAPPLKQLPVAIKATNSGVAGALLPPPSCMHHMGDLLQLEDDGEESDLIFGLTCHGMLQSTACC